MNIFELDSYNLADAVKFNDQLNPKIWQGQKMRPEVRAKLLAIAEDFKEFLGLTDLEVKDITVSGSNANYSYTPHSDIDLHLVVDIPKADSDEVYRELFDAKKYQYNDQHNYTIGGYEVELYVENANTPPVSKGVYSVINDDWINIPRKIRSDVDDDAVRSKYEDLSHRIEQAIKTNNSETINRLAKKIKAYRQAGLDEHGELGSENLAYKLLRHHGLIKKLYDALNAAKDAELSLRERKKPRSVFTYGFKHEESVAEVAVPEPKVNTTIPSDEEILKDFIKFCFNELKLKHMPEIKLRRDPQWSVRHKTFGRYIDDLHRLEVAWGQRHIMDVLRTVAHELTHKRQHEREDVPPSAGETGSPFENEANARAGVLMRDYARLHPEFFTAGQANALKEASGYIPTAAEADDPRFKMALSVDVRPGALGRAANALDLHTDSQGHPQLLRADGLFESLLSELKQFKKGTRDPNRIVKSQVPGSIEDELGNQEATGPEFPPQMPAGTTKVDVSDLTDWYRLGQDISDMDDADPADYNQGPPQTIITFPSDEIEQGYLTQLARLGLKTHDMDPDVKGGEDVTGKHQPTKEGIAAPVNKTKDAEQYYKFIIGKYKLGRPLTRQEQEFVRTYKMFGQQVAESVKLDEVRMAPSNLKQFANSPEAEGIQAGFEAELIFRDTINADDGEDMEPDYDADERCRSIQQVIDFFNNGDYGGLSPRQESALQNGLDEQYFEWQDEKMYDAFRDEAPDLVRDIWLEERPWDERIHDALVEGVGVTDQEADAIVKLHDQRAKGEIKGSEMSEEQLDMVSQYSEAKSIADDILDEDVQNSIDKQDGYYDQALDNFREDFYVDDDSGFFDDIGLRWMSDVAEGYDLDWPYLTGSSNSGSRDWEEIGDSLNKAIDMPVKVSSGYHQATRKPGLWIVEPDSSLDPDDSDDYGLEIVSPPMPLKQALEKLQQVTDWANSDEGNAYTNSSTGLHMGVSIPYKEGRVDYLKLILFLGDEYVLQQYGREANTYTKAAMREIRQRAGTEKNATAVLELLKSNLLELAEREIAKTTGEGKYTSAHKQGKYIEFRSAGGDWLAEDNADPGKLENTMMRYAYAMYLAGRPDLERREYAKKLYKLVAGGADDSTMALFSQYAAGELDKDQLKKRWAEKTLSKEAPSAIAKNNWVVVNNNTGKTVPGHEYNGYTEDEVRERAKAKLSPASSDRDFDQSYSIHPKETGKWEVYRDDQGQEETLEIIDADRRGEAVDLAYDKYTGVIPFKVRPYYGDQEAAPEPELSPRAKLAKRIVKPKPQPQPEQVQARASNGVPYWNIVDRDTGHVVHTLADHDRMTAYRSGMAWLQSVGAEPGYEDRFGIEPKMADGIKDIQPNVEQNFDRPQDATEIPRNWEYVDRITGRVVDTVSNASYNQANTVQADIERRYPDADIYLRSVTNLEENFADGKGPGRPGDSQRHGIPKGATIAQLEKAAKAPGRKGQLARWQLNMRRGKKK